MRNILLCIVLLVVVSCSTKDAETWNKNLIETYNKAIDEVDDFEELISLETVGDTVINQQIIELGNKILAHVDRSLKSISEVEIPSGAKDSQVAMLAVLESLKCQVNQGLKFVEFTTDTPEVDIDQYADDYDEISRTTASNVNKLRTVHKSFEEDLK